MLALTKKTGYGLIAMAHLAALPSGHLASAREIAAKYGVPKNLLMNTMKRLASAGYVQSVRGAHGGYRLGRTPQSVTLSDLITTLEGPIRMAGCLRDGQADNHAVCQMMARCPIADPVHRVQRKLNDFFQNMTLADLMEPVAAGRE